MDYFKDKIQRAMNEAELLAANGDYLGAIYKLTDALQLVVQALPDEK